MISEKNFFEKQTPSSKTKASIVADYFPQYARIIDKKEQDQIWYMDLFAGPGLYEDGNHSTPLLIAKACAADPRLKQKVRLIFNDNKYAAQLEANFKSFFPDGTFRFEPAFRSRTVGEDKKILEFLNRPVTENNPTPTLLFVDPWGYKGVNTLALANFLSNWGNELFLFVNIKRINAAIDNNKFDELMQDLFPTSIENLRKDKKYKAKVTERLNLIIENLAFEFQAAVNEKLYYCPFKFQEEDSIATSHYILHFTKHSRGYELIKQIYTEFDNIGTVLENGVYTFDAKRVDQEDLFGFVDQNVEPLSKRLEQKYKGRKLSAIELFEEDHPETMWGKRHYSNALRDMVSKGKLNANFTDNRGHRFSVLISNHCILQFK